MGDMSTEELRAKILSAYGIDEADPDWVALDEAIGPAEREAKAQREHFEQVVIPAHIAAVEARLNAQLPDGLVLKFGD